VKIKANASLDGIKRVMRHAMKHAEEIWLDLGHECVITSGTEFDGRYHDLDGVFDLSHSAGSLHYSGYAIDLRTRYFKDKGKEAARRLSDKLSQYSNAFGRFQVILESNHIHVEWDD